MSDEIKPGPASHLKIAEKPTVLPVTSTLPLSSLRVLNAAIESNIDDAVVIGMKNGKLYFAGAPADGAKVNMLLDLAKRQLLEIIENGKLGHRI